MQNKLMKTLFTIFGRIRKGPFVGAAAIIVKDNKMLLLKERMGYSLPGGLVDYNEDPQDAVIREVKEETGLNVIVKRRIDVLGSPLKDAISHSIKFLYECDILSGELKGSWEGTPEWVEINKIPSNMQHGYSNILKDILKNKRI